MTFSAAAVPAKKVAAAVAVRMLIRRFNVFHFTARCCAPPRTLPNLKGVPRAALHYFALCKGKYASALTKASLHRPPQQCSLQRQLRHLRRTKVARCAASSKAEARKIHCTVARAHSRAARSAPRVKRRYDERKRLNRGQLHSPEPGARQTAQPKTAAESEPARLLLCAKRPATAGGIA